MLQHICSTEYPYDLRTFGNIATESQIPSRRKIFESTFCRLGGGASMARPRVILSTGIVDWDAAMLGFVDWDFFPLCRLEIFDPGSDILGFRGFQNELQADIYILVAVI